uniref:CHK kinase-like domain-containing protein n=1 Tax=Megaselia scalaris TaxID=36166 RepID=T1GI07_MEGSC
MPMFRDGFPFFLDMLKTIPDLQEYVPIFERILANSPVDKAYLMFDNCKANWMVLTHGDFHLKNTMIRYNDDESVDDILLIDFQACCWGPVVTDIIYMLYLMLDSKDRLERRDEAVYHYYKEFTDTLHQIGFSGDFPKLSDLYKDILLFKDYELLLAISLLPYVPQAMRGGVEIEVFMNNEQMRRDLYQQADYHDEVRKLLPYFLHRGYLD